MGMIGDFLRAVSQVFDGRFTGVLLRSVGLTVALLAAVTAGAVFLTGFLPASFDLPLIGEIETPFAAARGLAIGAMLLLSAFLMFPVAALFVGLYLDRIAEAVEARHYPDQPPARPMPIGEAMRGALWFMCIVIAVNLVGLIFYLISGPLAPLIFWTVNGYLFGREYFELVALRRLQPPEMRALRRKNGFQIWLSGALMAVPLSVPIVNLVVPVIGVATYTHMYHRLSGNRPMRRA
ncbi:MAG: EI24 domain-containing protein [Paracoccaceae bacterium]|nr:EI24 domain-containing protein [Paracoccaceae bacterium]